MKIRRIATAVLAVTSLVGGLTACGNSSSADSGTTVKVGVVGDSNEVWDQVVIPNLKKEGINVELVKFSDYIQPNEALDKGDIDLTPTRLHPHGRLQQDARQRARRSRRDGAQPDQPVLRQGQEGRRHSGSSEVTIANDSVNAARGLLLLQSAGLIKPRLQGRYEPHAGRHRVQPEEPEDHRAGSFADRPFAARRRSQRHQRVHALDAGLNPSRTPSTSSRSTSSPSRTTTSSSPAPRIRTTPPTRRSWTPTAATTSRN